MAKDGSYAQPSISNERLKRLVKKHGKQEIADVFHKHISSVHVWMKDDGMPAYVGLMCEGIERRGGGIDNCVIVVRPGEDTELVVELLKKLKVRHFIVN